MMKFPLLAAIFAFSFALPAFATEELLDSPPAPPIQVGEEISADAVNLIFLFDRVATKSSTVRSKEWLQRVSTPSSPLYRDYLEYRSGRVSQAELARRLPHIAMLGDSLTQNFYISGPVSVFWRARTHRRKNWFLDTDPAPESIFSFYERLDRCTPLVASEYNGAGALVAPSDRQVGLRRRLARTRNLSGQTERVVRKERFPDLIMIWIGHNNTDWVEGLSPAERQHPEKHIREMTARFGKNYSESLQRLLDRAKTADHKVAIVVFGMANFEAFSKGHLKAVALHAKNPKLYPYLEAGYRSFEALKPIYHANTIRVGVMMDQEMKTRVLSMGRELKNYPNVRLQFSDALTKVDFSRLELINPVDAWHPSIEGHKVLSEAAFNAIGPSLNFLGINRQPALERGAR